MDCKHCKKHILATTQISWQGNNYHQECIGEAVAKHRASQERMNNLSSDLGESSERIDYEAHEDDYPFEDEYSEYEANDDLDDIIERLDNEPDVSDEILNQIPISQVSGASGGNQIINAGIPPNGVIVAPRAIINASSNSENNKGNGNLVNGAKGSRFVSFPELKNLPLPETTSTFKPVPFYDFVTKVLDGLYDRRMRTVNEQFIISGDGMKLFGLLELEHEYDGVRFAVGLRSSNDKSMKLALACGYKVMCCSNGMLSGDFMPLSVKHSAKLDIDDSLALGIDRIRRRFGNMQLEIAEKKARELTTGNAESLIYKAFTAGKFPISLFRTVHKEYFVEPSYKEFEPRNLFSLENAFTTSFKKLQPIQQFEAMSRLAKFSLERRN